MSEPLRVLTQRFDQPDAHTLEGYERTGGYEAIRQVLRADSDHLITTIKDSGLRGRGGAGFPTGVKWSFTSKNTGKPIYLVVNADEGEPGTFKDRELMERDPHQLIEGILCGARALDARRSFIFLRGEYLWPGIRLEEAIAEAYANGYLGHDILGSGWDHDLTLHYAAGAYICGEETALLDALEGRRGQPRLRPPFPAAAGLYGAPTQVNNVETLMNLPHLFNHGVAWYRSMGTEKSPGPKVYCVSGEVNKPGNYEWPMGTPARTIVDESCGGMLPDRELKFWAPGGSSTPLLTADHFDIGMDFDSIAGAGSLLGTGAMMMYSNRTSVVDACLNWTKFYEHESCGKCTPCREGTFWLAQVLERILHGQGRMEDLQVLDNVCDNIFGRSFCALGDGATSPIKSGLKYFRNEFVELIETGGLPDHFTTHAGPVTDNAGLHRPGGNRGNGQAFPKPSGKGAYAATGRVDS